jgi:hypothetical protein
MPFVSKLDSNSVVPKSPKLFDIGHLRYRCLMIVISSDPRCVYPHSRAVEVSDLHLLSERTAIEHILPIGRNKSMNAAATDFS